MAFGSLLTLIGYHFGNIDNNNANAQENAPIVDVIRCRSLVIVGDDNTHRIILSTDQFDRGDIGVYNEDGARRVYLGVTTFDGVEGGSIDLIAKDSGGVSVALGTDLYGGYMILYNRNAASTRPVVHASITPTGRGVIVLRDKIGQQTTNMYGQFGELFQIRDIRRTQ